MDTGAAFRRGCFLGLAIGDALGYPADGMSWEQIREAYGDSGLLGFDLQNDELAEITSYTQIAAFAACGLLCGMTQGEGQYSEFLAAGFREWAKLQQTRLAPTRGLCWVGQLPQFRRRASMDTRMVESLIHRTPGSIRKPSNDSNTPGALTAAVAVGLFFAPGRMDPGRIGTLGAQVVALSHGDPETFLAGALIAYTVAGILQDPDTVLGEQFTQAIRAVSGQFGARFPQQAEALEAKVRKAFALVKRLELEPRKAMEQLGCETAAECVSGAFYSCLIHPGSFDEAITAAVNHSGRSGATGALAGAIMGAKLGEGELKEFYLDSLECTHVIRRLAEDLNRGCRTNRLFDDSWDLKYTQGQAIFE